METVYEFIKVLSQIQLLNNVQKTVNDLYEELETVDVDLCVPTIKRNNRLSQEVKNKIIYLIDFYFSNIDWQINNFSCKNATLFLTELKNKAKELEFLIPN